MSLPMRVGSVDSLVSTKWRPIAVHLVVPDSRSHCRADNRRDAGALRLLLCARQLHLSGINCPPWTSRSDRGRAIAAPDAQCLGRWWWAERDAPHLGWRCWCCISAPGGLVVAEVET
jgi:hypothetical protein